MPSAKPSSVSPQPTTQIDPTVIKLIEEQVIHVLGRPPNLVGVQVRNLWGDRYRVNVFVGLNAASASIIRSFFLIVDDTGRITKSMPEIARAFVSDPRQNRSDE
jgi:hypothetical protein